MNTIANQIAERFGNDGQVFYVNEGDTEIGIEEVCMEKCTSFEGERRTHGQMVRYEFNDGSAIVVQNGYCWDIEGDKPFQMAGE